MALYVTRCIVKPHMVGIPTPQLRSNKCYSHGAIVRAPERPRININQWCRYPTPSSDLFGMHWTILDLKWIAIFPHAIILFVHVSIHPEIRPHCWSKFFNENWNHLSTALETIQGTHILIFYGCMPKLQYKIHQTVVSKSLNSCERCKINGRLRRSYWQIVKRLFTVPVESHLPHTLR